MSEPEEQPPVKYKYAFLTTVILGVLTLAIVGLLLYTGLIRGVDGQIDPTVTKALDGVGAVVSALLGTRK